MTGAADPVWGGMRVPEVIRLPPPGAWSPRACREGFRVRVAGEGLPDHLAEAVTRVRTGGAATQTAAEG